MSAHKQTSMSKRLRSRSLEPSAPNSSRSGGASAPIPAVTGTKRSLSQLSKRSSSNQRPLSTQGSSQNPICIENSDSETDAAPAVPAKKRKNNQGQPVVVTPPPVKLHDSGSTSDILINLQEHADNDDIAELQMTQEEDLIDLEGHDDNIDMQLQEEDLIDLNEYDDSDAKVRMPQEENLIDLEGHDNFNVKLQEEDLIDLEFEDDNVKVQEEDLIDLEGYDDNVDLNSQMPQEPLFFELIDLTESDDSDLPLRYHHFIGAYESSVVLNHRYSGALDLEQEVYLIRDLDDEDDFNSIQIFDVAGELIGHLPQDQAAILSPRMDNNEIVLNGCVSDNKNPHELNIYVHLSCIYEDEAARDDVAEEMAQEGISFIEDSLRYIVEERKRKLEDQVVQAADDEAVGDVQDFQMADQAVQDFQDAQVFQISDDEELEDVQDFQMADEAVEDFQDAEVFQISDDEELEDVQDFQMADEAVEDFQDAQVFQISDDEELEDFQDAQVFQAAVDEALEAVQDFQMALEAVEDVQDAQVFQAAVDEALENVQTFQTALETVDTGPRRRNQNASGSNNVSDPRNRRSPSVRVSPPFWLEEARQAQRRREIELENYAKGRFGLSAEDLEILPTTTQPEALSSQLLPYQLQGLKWLLDHENPVLPKCREDNVQFWTCDPKKKKQYRNLVTKVEQVQPPNLICGGILADDMGLGKTLQMISLILADKERGGAATSTEKGTLIVAPVTVMSNWEQQIRDHIKPGCALKVHRVHGSRKEVDLDFYDVVITSYGTISSEYDIVTGKKKGKSLLFEKKWHRIILDEGHQIRNSRTKCFLSVNNIQAKNKWILTGTPIINNLKDLFALVNFLRISGGLESLEVFESCITRPINSGSIEGKQRLQSLLAHLCLRRRKDMKFVNLKIPAIKEFIHKVRLTREERDRYQFLEAEARSLLNRYERMRNGDHSRRRRGDGEGLPVSAAHEMLERLLRLRQLCNHTHLCGQERLQAIERRLQELANAEGMGPERIRLLQERLQISIDSQEDCPICLDQLEEPRITPCMHVFCLNCISRVIVTQKKCPMCRGELANADALLVEPGPVEPVEPVPVEPVESIPVETEMGTGQVLPEALADGTPLPPLSSKLNGLLAILKATRQKDSSTKTIVFSQWTKFLDLAAPHITFAGFRFCRMDGTMSVQSRDKAIARLSLPKAHPDGVDLMLASLGVANVGLNLVAANQVILSDSWWAPAVEDQAVDRVHRLGQTRETSVWRLVVEDSIEQRVLEVQKEKRKLVDEAFMEDQASDGEAGQGGRKRRRGEGKETRLADLARLLGVAPGPA